MTDDELKAIRARANAATPGPWTGDPEPYNEYIFGADSGMVADTDVNEKPDAVIRIRGAGEQRWRPEGQRDANYHFILHAREDIPALLTEVDRLRKVLPCLERLIEAADHLRREHDCDLHGFADLPQIADEAMEWLAENKSV